MIRVLACFLVVGLLCGHVAAGDQKPKNDHKSKKSTNKKKPTDKRNDHHSTAEHRTVNPATAAKIRQLREEVHQLRRQEHAVLVHIDARYRRVLAKLDAPADQLELERNRLRAEEHVVLQDLPPGPQRKQVRAEYRELVGLLNADIRHDVHRMDRLRLIRDNAKRHVRAAFGVKIRALEHEIRVLEGSGGARPLGAGRR